MLSARLGVMFALFAALMWAPMAMALTPAQEQNLRAEIAAQARQDPPSAQRIAFTREDIAGTLILGDPESEGALTCRHAIIELAKPERAALETKVCRSKMSVLESIGKPQWSANEPLTSAHAAAGEGHPPPAPAAPTIEAEKAPATTDTGSPPSHSQHRESRSYSPPPGAPNSGQQSAPSETGGGVDRVLSPVLVELGPTEARFARHGGSGMVLLSETTADEALNLSLCHALFKAFDTATSAEVEAGERRRDDQIQLLRPLYWPLKDLSRPALGADKCTHRIAHYDFVRAWKVRSKLGLSGRGPYLLVIRADETRAGLVDFTGIAEKDVPDLVRYFRDGFSQENDIWTPERHGPDAERVALTSFMGHPLQLAALPRLVVVSVVRAGCPLGDFFDVCANPLPHN